MSRAIERQLERIEKVLLIAEDGGRRGQEWVPPEEALGLQRVLLGYWATWVPKPDWFDERRAAVEAMFPSGGYWRPRASPEDDFRAERRGELIEATVAASPQMQALAKDGALRARLAAESRSRLISYLPAGDVLLPVLLAEAEDYAVVLPPAAGAV
jgi:hypothetical protein